MTKQNYEYKSVFKSQLDNLITEKKLILSNCSIERYKSFSKFFDLWCIENNIGIAELSKELIEKWMLPRKSENSLTRQIRASYTREFAKSIIKNGRKAYIIPLRKYKGTSEHIPYIYTDKEIRDFLNACTTIKNDNHNLYRKEMYSLIFKLLIFTGARKSEVLNLKLQDINLKDKYITILNGKEYTDRIIPLSDELLIDLENYYKIVSQFKSESDYFFCIISKCLIKSNKTCNSSLKDIFRKCLEQANISYKNINEGPRIHDFRFTFTVKAIKKLIENKKDLNIYLARLSKYLGHASLQDTLYYYKPLEAIFNQTSYKRNILVPKISKENFYEE